MIFLLPAFSSTSDVGSHFFPFMFMLCRLLILFLSFLFPPDFFWLSLSVFNSFMSSNSYKAKSYVFGHYRDDTTLWIKICSCFLVFNNQGMLEGRYKKYYTINLVLSSFFTSGLLFSHVLIPFPSGYNYIWAIILGILLSF